jgi:nicotinamidase-related amidase
LLDKGSKHVAARLRGSHFTERDFSLDTRLQCAGHDSFLASLRAHKVKRLILAGVSTAWAVQATARDAHDRDYQVVVVEDACAAASENEHKTSMELLGQIAKNSNTSRSFT